MDEWTKHVVPIILSLSSVDNFLAPMQSGGAERCAVGEVEAKTERHLNDVIYENDSPT